MAVLDQRFELVDVDSIEPHERNTNENDVDAIAKSIDALGFYGACVVQQSSSKIIAGKHRWLAAQQAGETSVPVLFVDIDDETALRVMLGDNAYARRGRDRPDALAQLLTELSATDTGLAGTGYGTDDLDTLLSELVASASESQSESADDPFAGFERREIDAVDFRFGDYAAKLSRPVYDSFIAAYEAKREETNEVMLDEVLLSWLGIAST